MACVRRVKKSLGSLNTIIIRFNLKEYGYFLRAVKNGVIKPSVCFSDFVKDSYFDAINRERIKRINKELGGDDFED